VGDEQWLMDYAYRINIQWWVFAITALMIYYFIAYGGFIDKAGLSNPVKSLRTE